MRLDLLLHHLQRRVVADQVVHAASAAATGRCAASSRDARPQQRRPPQVHPVAPRIDSAHSCSAASPPPRPARTSSTGSAPAATPPAPARAALPTAPPCAGCRAGRSPPAAPPDTRPAARGCRSASSARQQVRIALARQQVMEQDAFLQRRQRIDVLHVRRAARHRRHDPRRSRPGVSSTSGSISGVMRCAVRRDPVRRHLAPRAAAPAHRRGQLGQRRRGEQRPHVGVQPRCAQPLDQRDRQQRVAAELEEVVVPADPLHAAAPRAQIRASASSTSPRGAS